MEKLVEISNFPAASLPRWTAFLFPSASLHLLLLCCSFGDPSQTCTKENCLLFWYLSSSTVRKKMPVPTNRTAWGWWMLIVSLTSREELHEKLAMLNVVQGVQ